MYTLRYLAWAYSILVLVLPGDWPAMKATNYMLKWKMVTNAILTNRFFPQGLVERSQTREAQIQLNLSL